MTKLNDVYICICIMYISLYETTPYIILNYIHGVNSKGRLNVSKRVKDAYSAYFTSSNFFTVFEDLRLQVHILCDANVVWASYPKEGAPGRRQDRFLVILDSSFSSKYIGIALHVLRGDLNNDANLRHHCLCGRCDGKYSTCRETRRTGIVSLDLS